MREEEFVSNAFASLDPLLVLEELAEASAGARGGKTDAGDAMLLSIGHAGIY